VSLPADWLQRLPRALHPVATPPDGPGWNLPELADLLPAEPLRPAAVLVGLIDRPEGPSVLLTRRHEQLRHHAGQIAFPGGRIEAQDRGPVDAALREAAEEVGLSAAHVETIGFLDPFVTITGFHVIPVVARVATAFAAVPDPHEVDEVFEAPLAFLLDPANEHTFSVQANGRERRVIEMQFGTYRIWGATAAMLVNFRRRLEAVA
jgi:8-oxo-dGTP pyrophosphatase MutT (NUDIX family)